jgi:hypothetical protein
MALPYLPKILDGLHLDHMGANVHPLRGFFRGCYPGINARLNGARDHERLVSPNFSYPQQFVSLARTKLSYHHYS